MGRHRSLKRLLQIARVSSSTLGAGLTVTAGTAPRYAPYVPRLIVEWLRRDPEATLHTLDGTLVFVDISGFTAMSERLSSRGKAGAEEVTEVMNATFARLLDVAYGEGGTLLKFGGDALLLFFAGDGHAARGTKAAVGMRRALADLGAPRTSAGLVELRLHAAIHSGSFDFFLAGEIHRELVVAGPAVTRTVELEDAGDAGDIIVSAETAAALAPGVLGDEKAGGYLVKSAPEAQGTFEPLPDVSGLPLELFVPPPVRRHALADTHESEHRQAAVAFVRFGGTDALETAPRGDAIDALVRIVQEACAAHAVTFLESDIDKTGGRIVLVAGVPETEGGDEERLLRTLRAIVEAEPPLPLRIGANRGRVFAGLIGTSFRRTYTILGDTAALAARLMAKAEDGQILASAAIVERSATLFDTRELEPFLVKGKSDPVHAFELGSIAGRAASVPARRLPMVDRQRERALLTASLGTVRAGFGSFVELIGDAGIGKSRLTEDLIEQCTDMRRLETACEQYESSTPYFPFRDLLRRILGVELNGNAGTNSSRIAARLDEVAPDLKDWIPLLAIPLDVDVEPTQAVNELDPSFRRARLHGVVSTLLDQLLPEQTLMLFEDVHWMDEASSDLLRHLGTQVSTKPWLACATRRPVEGGFSALEGIPPVPAITLRLDPLPEADAHELAVAAGADRLLDHELVAITQRAGGNPLFLQQLIAAGHGEDQDELPETVEAALAARIDRLDPGDRALLRWASVLGVSFSGTIVASVLEEDETAAEGSEAWDRLAEFVERDPAVAGGFRFRHALIRDAAYDGLPYRRRQELHERVARVYEERHTADPEDAAELLSLHFLRAGVHAEAWHYSLVAGLRAQGKWANVEAADFYRRALDAAPHVATLEPDAVADVWESLADVLELAGEFEVAAAAFAEARALAPTDAQAGLLLKEGKLRAERMGRYAEAIEWYERGYAVAGDSTRLPLAMAHAAARFRQGEFEDCIRRCNEIVRQANERADLATLAHAYYLLHVLYTMAGSPERAAFRGLALPIYEELGDLSGQASVLNNLGIEAYYEGRWDEALELYERSRELRRRTGDVTQVAVQTNNIGEILSDQGRLEEAEELFRQSMHVADAAGHELTSHVARSNLGRAAARAGRFNEAENLLEHALRSFRDMGAMFVIETEARLAELDALRGRPDGALARATPTLDAAREAGGLAPVEALLLRVIGVAHAELGDIESARRALDEGLAVARRADAPFEVALTSDERARVLDESDAATEAATIFIRLGVVAVPEPPLP
jgi:class 3 adenylate cyclase/tetratricopeptide (TPR) repeat protein